MAAWGAQKGVIDSWGCLNYIKTYLKKRKQSNKYNGSKRRQNQYSPIGKGQKVTSHISWTMMHILKKVSAILAHRFFSTRQWAYRQTDNYIIYLKHALLSFIASSLDIHKYMYMFTDTHVTCYAVCWLVFVDFTQTRDSWEEASTEDCLHQIGMCGWHFLDC